MTPGDFLTKNNLKIHLAINVLGTLFSVTFFSKIRNIFAPWALFHLQLLFGTWYFLFKICWLYKGKRFLNKAIVIPCGRDSANYIDKKFCSLFATVLKFLHSDATSYFVRNVKCLNAESRVMERVNPLRPVARRLGFTLEDRHSSPPQDDLLRYGTVA